MVVHVFKENNNKIFMFLPSIMDSIICTIFGIAVLYIFLGLKLRPFSLYNLPSLIPYIFLQGLKLIGQKQPRN